MTVQLQRDPFARSTLMRDKARDGRCDACARQGRRWRYYWEDDRVRPAHASPQRERAFCSTGCFRSHWG